MCASRESAGSLLVSGVRSTIEPSTGMTVTETSSEASRAATTMTENEKKISLTKPPTSPMGRNTALVAMVEEAMAVETSVVPLTAASRRGSPRSRCL
jgi:hypothetical protein